MSEFEMILYAVYKNDESHSANHIHLSCEMIYVKRGKAKFTVCDKTCILSKGQFILITAMDEHSVEILETPYERYCFTISSEKMITELKNPMLTNIFLRHTKDSFYLFNCVKNIDKVEFIAECLLQEYQFKQPMEVEMVSGLMHNLFILLYRNNESLFEIENDFKYDAMLKVQNYIEEHFMKDIKIEELADQAFLSVGYLSHSFKDYSGYSPKQYITQTRLLYAKELLLTTDKPIQVVAEHSGFSDTNNFIRKFKSYFEITPKKFREKKGK